MAHYKRRKRPDQRGRTYAHNAYLARGFQKRDYWDNYPKGNIRAILKRTVMDGWEDGRWA